MVSSLTLAYIHSRLNEIFPNQNNSFGNQNIILFGDLLQVNISFNFLISFYRSKIFLLFKLPPVGSDALFCFEQLTSNQMKKHFGGLPLLYNFWDEFSYLELTKSMRQKDEEDFYLFLNRIRIGMPSEEDINCLKRLKIHIRNPLNKIKEAAQFYNEIQKNLKSIIALFALNSDVDEFNINVSKINNINLVSIRAEDNLSKKNLILRKNKHKENQKCLKNKKKTSETAGLEENLLIGENCRVILRRNIDISKGLCNGRLGFVTKLYYSNDGSVVSLDVIFDGDKTASNIVKVSSKFEISRNVYATRSQFPLSLAWAITIHKSQSLSLDGLILDLGKSIFEPGMAYVALSRARTMKHIYLIDFECSSLKCNPKPIHEYNRLRKIFQPHLPQIVIKKHNEETSNKKKNMFSVLLDKDLKQNSEFIQNDIKLTKKRKFESISKIVEHPEIKRKCQRKNYFIRLQNSDGLSCYANATLQALLSCGSTLFNTVTLNIF